MDCERYASSFFFFFLFLAFIQHQSCILIGRGRKSDLDQVISCLEYI